MRETELAALVALVNQETVLMDSENHFRLRDGVALAYDNYGYYFGLLEAELKKRGIAK